MRTKTNNLNNSINYFLIFIYITWSLIPYFQRRIAPRYIITFCLVWSALYLIRLLTSEMKITYILLFTIAWIIILIMQYMRVQDYVAVGNLYTIILFFFPVFLFSSIKDTINETIFLRLSNYIFIITLINSISNIYILIGNPTASKYMTGSVEGVVEIYNATNLATISHVTVVALIIPIIYTYFKQEKGMKRLFYSLTLITSVFFIIMSGAFITLITLILEIFILLILKSRKGYTRLLGFMSFTIILFGVFLSREFVASVLRNISYSVNNPFYSARLYEIALFLIGADASGSLSARLNDIYISMNTFLKNMLIGKGLIYSQNIRETGVGMHSQVINDFARFGLTGFLFQFIILYKYFKNYYFTNCKYINNVVLSILGGTLFYAFFNIFSNQVYGLLLFFILPIFIKNSKIKNNV